MKLVRASRILTAFALGWLPGACATSSDAPAQASEPAAASPTLELDGQALYRKHCLTCHQADGGGVPNMQPPILDSAWVKGAPQPLALFVMTGGFDSAARKESDVGNVMPAFPQLSNEELAALLTYVRQKFGDGSGAVAAADVAAARKSLP